MPGCICVESPIQPNGPPAEARPLPLQCSSSFYGHRPFQISVVLNFSTI